MFGGSYDITNTYTYTYTYTGTESYSLYGGVVDIGPPPTIVVGTGVVDFYEIQASVTLDAAPVPEPGTLLLAPGLAGLAWGRPFTG